MKNPYSRVPSPFAITTPGSYSTAKPTLFGYNQYIQKIVRLNATLNVEAQAAIDEIEPTSTIWDTEGPVSYTHLTLPTICSVSVSVGAFML